MDSGWEEEGIEQGSTDSDSDPSWPSLSRDTLPSFLSPLTLSALLICHCPTLFIQQSVLFYSCLPGPVCIWWICTVVRPQPRCLASQSLLTSLPCPSFKMNKQKQWGQLSLDLFLAMGNFLYFESLNGALFQSTEEQ